MEKAKIVPKAWGSEEWIVNRDYCGKILNLKKGFRCSYHYHKNKDETFYLQEGKIILELDGKVILMNSGDSQLINPKQKHSFIGIEDSKIFEFSTHHDNSDSYREKGRLSGEVSIKEMKELLGGIKQ